MGRSVRLLYGMTGMELTVPESAVILTGTPPPPLAEPITAVHEAIMRPIGCQPLAAMLAAKRPATAAITISDITRPVPNREFLPVLLDVLAAAGVDDSRIVIIIGTGMHRPSTDAEREKLVGRDVLNRIEVIDHRADAPETLVTISENPPVRVCRRFVEAEFRIVTGYIEPHFMAGFSGGRKGVCPALVDLETIQRFHGYRTLADPRADNGNLRGNPCHAIALEVARSVGVDFLLNVAITGDRRTAAVYAGDLEKAHALGCEQMAAWTTATVDEPFDLVITNGGGAPLDATFYQTVKGQCTALPALHRGSTLLQVSECAEQIGSPAYANLMLRYDNDWRRFLADIKAAAPRTELDQWEFQLQARVLDRIGREKLWLVTDGIDPATQHRLAVTPCLGPGDVRARAQRAIDSYAATHREARIAVIPEGPYTMLSRD